MALRDTAEVDSVRSLTSAEEILLPDEMPKVLMVVLRDLNCSGGWWRSKLDVKNTFRQQGLLNFRTDYREAQEFPALEHQKEPEPTRNGRGARREV